MNDIVVISGPSGSGKSTLINRLMGRCPELVFSVSHTTRHPRANEVDGRDYHFITKDQFDEMVQNNEFVEWADVYGYFYGTGFREIEARCDAGSTVVLDVDVQGARKIRETYPEALLVFIVPPSFAELKRRLTTREKKIDNHIENRLSIAQKEISEYGIYDYIVVNDDLEESFRVLDGIYTAFRHAGPRQEFFIKKLLDEIKGDDA